MGDFNPWLSQTLLKANKKVEDSDRRNLSDRMFIDTICRVWKLATTSVIRCEAPQVTRTEDDDTVLLCIEWEDPTSDWCLYIGVIRHRGEKPTVTMGFDGEESYGTDKPTDEQLIKALQDYFWYEYTTTSRRNP